MKRSTAILIAVCLTGLLLTLPAVAQKQATNAGEFFQATANGPRITPGAGRGTPDATVNVDITGVESWDVLDDPDNTTLLEVLGANAVMTGIAWNVTLETVGASWLSEQVMYFDGDDLDGSGLFLTVGLADGMSGTANYNSGGIIDLSDNLIPNIPVGVDDTLYIQFFESLDDVAGAVDSFYIDDGAVAGDSTLDLEIIGPDVSLLEVPTLSTFGIAALLLLLAGVGVYRIRA